MEECNPSGRRACVVNPTARGRAAAYAWTGELRQLPGGATPINLSFLRRVIKTPSDVAIADPAIPPDSGEIVVYGTAWCGDCWRARRFLDRRQVPYRWIDVGRDRAALEHVLALNHGMRSVPTLVFGAPFGPGSTLTEPSNAELARKLRVDP